MGEEKRRAGGDQLSESEAYEFATCVLSNEHMTPELQAFTFAWKGSINSQSEQGSSTLASSALQFDDFFFTGQSPSFTTAKGNSALRTSLPWA